MSLEAALDEERREIMNLLEGRRPQPTSPSPPNRHASPAPAIRSMLDIEPPAPRHGSIAGVGVGVTAPSSRVQPPVRSLLDSSSPVRQTHSATTSPTTARPPARDLTPARRPSDEAVEGWRRVPDRQGVDIDQDYRFEMLPSIPSQALPKRVSQGGKKKPGQRSSSMATLMSGSELAPLPGFTRGRDDARHSSIGFAGSSKSPSSRLGRSPSPGGGLLNTNSFNPMPLPGTFVTDHGKVINMDHAYRRLSNQALARYGGSLSNYSKGSRSERGSGTSVSETGEVRLTKDYYDDDDAGSTAIDSSDEERGYSSGSEHEWSADLQRGRQLNKKKVYHSNGSDGEKEDKEKRVRSLLAAAEEERKSVSSTYKVKSLLGPPPNASIEKTSSKNTGVHPATSFDAASGANTPVGSDEEKDLSDIKKAQNLSIHISPIDTSVPNRAIRTIVRGEFGRMQEECDQGLRRQRKYLVATDLSEESVYALEWVIGIILRDGDTLYAVYAVDEETGTGKTGDDPGSSVQIGEGAKAMQDTAAVISSLTKRSIFNPRFAGSSQSPQVSTSSLATGSRPGSVDSRAHSKPEAERLHAIDGISQTCVRLLRKTQLQVRVAVEVIHCKSPKHMITEAIDGLEPTLVVLGSRGRSALKGVLLGSFSNYLVAKSSQPVMVARKKLKKHAKYKNTNVRLSNNLTTPKKLAWAKID